MNFLFASGGWGSRILQTFVRFILSVLLLQLGLSTELLQNSVRKLFCVRFPTEFVMGEI